MKLPLSILIPFFTFVMLLFSNCSNPCKYSDCQNGGVCIDGLCQCPQGFSGEDCTAITSTLSARVDGITISAAIILYKDDADSTQFFPTIAATNANQSFQFGFLTGNAQGSYNLSDTLLPNRPAIVSWNTDSFIYNSVAGEIVVTRDNETRLEGIFHFTGVEVYNLDTVMITDGKFSIEK